LLGVHLGIADGLPGTNVTNGSLAKDKEKTDLEKLSALLDVRSIQWHENRHRVGQRFLDRFVRQNVAEIDEIPYEEHSVMVELPPAEKAIYLELEAHLKSLEMNSKKALKSRKTSSGDREARMQAVLEDSESAEEALLKRCAHFDMSEGTDSTALDVCDLIIRFRDEQLQSCQDDLLNLLVDALQQREIVLESHPEWLGMSDKNKGEVEDRLEVFISDIKKKNSVTGGADDEVQLRIQGILEAAIKEAGNGSPSKKKKKKNHTEDGELYNLKFKLREHMHKVRTATKELCGRIRSLRYFQWVRNFQLEETTVSCSGYNSPHCACSSATAKLSRDKVGVLSCCGHIGCLECLAYCADREVCIETHCQAPVKPGHVVSAAVLGADRDHANAGNYGEKLTKIVKHTHQLVQQGDRVIVFVQFKDLKMKVLQAMDDLGVKALEVKGSVAQKTKALDVFQKEVPGKDDPRCLLLTMNDESAAGVNLTNCNHAIFVHPLLTDTQKQYEMYMTQAIGRIRRYGQTKKVHVWRFLARDTIDMDIFEQRTGEKADDTLTEALTGPMPAVVPTKRKKAVAAAAPARKKRAAASPVRRAAPASPVVQKRKVETIEITSARKPTSKKAKREPEFYLKKRVAKFFDDDLFFGTVTHYVSDGEVWSVAYDDGDEEEYDARDMKENLKIYKEHADLDRQ
jgi:SNF2 family DNA or RNA helicase